MDKRTRKYGEAKRMSDVAMAREYVADIGGRGKGSTIVQRSFWERDAAHVKYREMVELHRAAEVAKAERELIALARKEHAEFIAKTTSIRALLERQDEDFHRPSIEGLRGVASGVDRTGTEE